MSEDKPESDMQVALRVCNADLRVAESRANAYQATCHVQGTKLLDIEKVLQLAEVSTKSDAPMHLRSFANPFLDAIRKILIRKEH